MPRSTLANLLNGWGLGTAAGPVMIALGLAALVVALILVTRLMKQLVSTRMELAVNSILSKRGGFMAVLAGLFMTLAVQSSGITNSIMVPLVAAGVISMPNAFTVILGADLGTTATAVLASVAASSPEALVIAMAHVVINFAGIFALSDEGAPGPHSHGAGLKTACQQDVGGRVHHRLCGAPVLILILS